MVGGGDYPRRAGRGRRGELYVELARPRVGVQAVQPPDVAGHVVDDAAAVGRRVARVEAVVVGVPAQVAAVQGGRVEVAGALVVGQEDEAAADDHRGGELAGELAEHPGEQRVVSAGHPQPAGGAAAVALPVRRVAALPGQQDRRGFRQRQVVDLAEREAPGRGAERHRVRHGALRGRLVDGGDGEHLAVPRPAGDAGPHVAPVGAARRQAAVGVRGVNLGAAAVTPARPGDRGAVRCEPRVAGLAAVGGQPRGAAAVRWCEPDVIFCHEGEQVIIDVRKAEITGGCHAVILRPPGGCPHGAVSLAVRTGGRSDPFKARAALRRHERVIERWTALRTARTSGTTQLGSGCSQPRSWATRTASARLRAPVFWMHEER